jgi:hypothetical protein
MTVSAAGNTVRVEVALTGSNVIREVLEGDAAQVGGGWSVTLKADSGQHLRQGHLQERRVRRRLRLSSRIGSRPLGREEGLTSLDVSRAERWPGAAATFPPSSATCLGHLGLGAFIEEMLRN